MKRIVLAIITLLTLTACASSTEIDGKKVTYDELDAMIEEREQTASNLEDEIKEKEEKLKDYESQLSEILTEFRENKTKYERLEEIADKEDEVNESLKEKESELRSLEKSIEEKQGELDSLTGDLVKIKGEPIKVNPGTFYFGSDIEVGRYKVTYQEGQRGNIYFRGSERFAETFGSGATQEYTFNGYDGEEIQFDIPALLYPVE